MYSDDVRRDKSWNFSRSGWATATIVGLLLLGLGLLWRAHQRARFHQLTMPVIPQTTSAPMPGGQEAILLSRVALVNDSEREFVSAAVLPGIGMQLLQASVAVPDEPAQDLFASLPLSDAARMPREDVNVAPFHLRLSTNHLRDIGMGEDLIGFAPATGVTNQTLVDGGQASGSFQTTAAKLDVSATVEVTLSGRQIDLIARATNHAVDKRFVAFEWSPRFAAPDGNLDHLGLAVPSRSELGAAGEDVSTGSFAGFANESGRVVGNAAFDLHFARLGREFLGDGTYVRLQNGNRFFLHIEGAGDALRSVRTRNDAASHSLLLDLSSMDPTADTEERDQMLRPGQTVQWRVRIEVLPMKRSQAAGNTH